MALPVQFYLDFLSKMSIDTKTKWNSQCTVMMMNQLDRYIIKWQNKQIYTIHRLIESNDYN